MRYALLILACGFIWGCSSDEGPVDPGPPAEGKDTIPPWVISTSPADSDLAVSVKSNITCTFSEPINLSCLARWSFYMSGDVTGVFSFDAATNTACFDPGYNLAYRKSYSVTITTGITDTAGNALKEDFHWSFSTTTPPQVIDVYPSDGDSNIVLNSVIRATFDRAMDPATLNNLTFKLDHGTSGTVVSSDRRAELFADYGLESNRTYTAVLTTVICDSAGNPLEAVYSWSFSTTRLPLMPLAIGNRWSYFVEKWDTSGQLTAQYYDTLLLDHTAIIGDQTWFGGDDERLYSIQDDGLWKTGIFGHRYLHARFPADIGDQYEGDPGWRLLGLQELIKVVDTKSQVITPAGTFSSYHYCVWVEGRHRYNYYYAPNLGLVKYEVYRNYAKSDWPVLIERWNLVDYSVAETMAD